MPSQALDQLQIGTLFPHVICGRNSTLFYDRQGESCGKKCCRTKRRLPKRLRCLTLPLGICQAVEKRVPPPPPYFRDMKILYVPQGFHAIDQGVASALRSLVKECIVGEAPKMLELAVKERPDLVLVMNGLHIFPDKHLEDVARIRGMGIKTAIWFVDDPYFTEDTARMCTGYDIVFTHELSCVPFYRGLGAAKVHYLPLAVNTAMFKPQRPAPQHLYDICFIGNAFWNRVAIFDEMAPFLEDKKVLIA